MTTRRPLVLDNGNWLDSALFFNPHLWWRLKPSKVIAGPQNLRFLRNTKKGFANRPTASKPTGLQLALRPTASTPRYKPELCLARRRAARFGQLRRRRRLARVPGKSGSRSRQAAASCWQQRAQQQQPQMSRQPANGISTRAATHSMLPQPSSRLQLASTLQPQSVSQWSNAQPL